MARRPPPAWPRGVWWRAGHQAHRLAGGEVAGEPTENSEIQREEVRELERERKRERERREIRERVWERERGYEERERKGIKKGREAVDEQ